MTRAQGESNQLQALLAEARRRANLGLPVGAAVRFRWAKRLVYRVSWLFLRDQIAFNHAMIEANHVLAEQFATLQNRIEYVLRDELIDFADRSVSQAHAEIGDSVAEARSAHAELLLELRILEEKLNGASGIDDGPHESKL